MSEVILHQSCAETVKWLQSFGGPKGVEEHVPQDAHRRGRDAGVEPLHLHQS